MESDLIIVDHVCNCDICEHYQFPKDICRNCELFMFKYYPEILVNVPIKWDKDNPKEPKENQVVRGKGFWYKVI